MPGIAAGGNRIRISSYKLRTILTMLRIFRRELRRLDGLGTAIEGEIRRRMEQEKHSSAPGVHRLERWCSAAGDAQVSTLLSDVLLHWQMIRLILENTWTSEATTILAALRLNLH